MLLEDKQQFKFGVVMTGISMVFLVLVLVVKWPRQTQIRRKTYKSKKKHQDKVQDAKRQEKAQKVKKLSIPSQHDDFHRATMEAACLPRKQKNKIWRKSVHRSTMCAIAARWLDLAPKLMKCTGLVIKLNWIFTLYCDGCIAARCLAEAHYENYK